MRVPSDVLYSLVRVGGICLIVFFSQALRLEIEAAERRPNIVLIMADDVGWEAFESYGGEDYRTPRLGRLAARGGQFDHCYSMPICTPSRVKIMTGQYNFRNYTHFGYLNPKEKTFGHLLQEAGYQTAIAGKWQLNGLYNSLPGNQDAQRPQKAGFHESLLWQVTKGKQTKNGGGERYWNPPLEHNGRLISREENWGKYGPDLLVDFICEFMTRHQDEPFFVYYPMVLVHDPFVRTPDTLGDQSLEVANRAPKDPVERKANFVAMVAYMDKLVGRIEDKIAELGLSEDTILLFTADNGTNRSITSQWGGRTVKGGKGGMKDMGTHVPLIAHWKGRLEPGSRFDDMIDFTDFYATFMDVAQVKPHWSDPVDGRSFYSRLQGETGSPRDWVFMHYQPYWGKQPGQFVRTSRHKLYRNGEFFDISADLDEANAIDPSAGTSTRAIHQRLQELLIQAPPVHTEVGDRNTRIRPTYADWPEFE